MREALAGFRTRFVDGAGGAFEKHAAGFLGSPQDGPFVLALGRIPGQECGGRDAKIAREAIHIALGKLHRGHTAAVRAHGTIDLLLNALRNAAQDAVRVGARLQVPPEAFVLRPLLFAQQLNLHQVRNHDHCISRAARSRSSCSPDTNCTASMPSLRAPSTYSAMSSV